jgi:serine/threonine protein kinase
MYQEQVLDGRYRLTERLGAGGMSVVWKAHDQLLNRSVAVKVLAGRQATTPDARLRIRAEAQAAAQLWHPNVTNVYDYGESATEPDTCVPYVVMELLPGRTLSQRLADGPLPPRAALRVCAEVASALAAAHDRGLVHRDVKPSNVMLTPSGAKVVDFGLAAVAGQAEIDDDGQLRGTPAYLAPERLTAGEVTPASDVYALGLLIHRALTNRLPWQADTTTQMLNAHVYIEPAPLPPTNGVLPEVNQICHRCLAKEPADRPSAGEVAAVLADAAGIVLMPQDDRSDPQVSTLPEPVVADDPNHALSSPPGSRPQSIDPAGRVVEAAPSTEPDRRRRRGHAVLLSGAVAAVVATTVTVALGVVLDRQDARPGDRRAAALPGSSSGPPSAAGAAPQGSKGGPAGLGASVKPTGPTPSGRSVDPANPKPVATKRSGRTLAPTSRAATLPPAQPGAPVSAYGGTARVRCDDKKAQILRLDVATGYTIDQYMPGPADEVKAVLISATNKSEIRVKCQEGAVAAQIKESPQ